MLDVDSSQLNFFFIDLLTELFPNAKFILTIRDPFSWLDSIINHQLARRCTFKWHQLRHLRFRPDLYPHGKEEEVLKKHNLFSLDGYLSYWQLHNQKVIKTIPENNLMIVPTHKISSLTQSIASFCGLNISQDEENIHSCKARVKYNILDQIDTSYLESKIDEHCGNLIKNLFSNIFEEKNNNS